MLRKDSVWPGEPSEGDNEFRRFFVCSCGLRDRPRREPQRRQHAEVNCLLLWRCISADRSALVTHGEPFKQPHGLEEVELPRRAEERGNRRTRIVSHVSLSRRTRSVSDGVKMHPALTLFEVA